MNKSALIERLIDKFNNIPEKDISDIDNQTKSLMSEFSSEELTELSLDYDKIHSILEESALPSTLSTFLLSSAWSAAILSAFS